MAIYKWRDDGTTSNPRRGPCDIGYHVPSSGEWQMIYEILTDTFGLTGNAITMGTYLKMPLAGDRLMSSSSVSEIGTRGYYWSSTGNNGATPTYSIQSGATTFSNHKDRAFGCSIRAFKDVVVIPDTNWTTLYQGTGSAGVFRNSSLGLISISGDGTNWCTIQDKNLGATVVYNQGDTLIDNNCGSFYQRGNNYAFPHSGEVTTSNEQIDASGYGPNNYYSSSTFITRRARPYDWSSVTNDNLWGGAVVGGIYWNQTLGLISIGSSGNSWLTIADKNLGATTVRNSGDTASESNCGKFYQWGNNYGFPYTGTITMDTTQVDVTNYGPNNYYSSSTFIKTNPWYQADNYNLWGGLTATNEATQGPCDTGFHIPDWSEIGDLRTHIIQFGLTRAQLFEYLKWSYGGKRSQYTGNVSGTVSTFWSATLSGTMTGVAQTVAPDYLINSTGSYTNDVSDGCSIRPFKNEPMIPDDTWTVLYQAS